MVDRNTKQYNDSFGSPDVPIQLLYASEGLSEGQHQIVMTNEAESYQPFKATDAEPARVGKWLMSNLTRLAYVIYCLRSVRSADKTRDGL